MLCVVLRRVVGVVLCVVLRRVVGAEVWSCVFTETCCRCGPVLY